MLAFTEELIAGGATLIQYRNKSPDARTALEHLRGLRRTTAGRARLIVNDRADLCLAAECDGVHLGQDDLPPDAARRILDAAGPVSGETRWIGFSTHNPAQMRAAGAMPVDYVAIGPVFPTRSKEDPDPVVGLEGVAEARRLTDRPLVAIGGITRENCRAVIEAGADCVAIISDLVESPRMAVQEFLRVMR